MAEQGKVYLIGAGPGDPAYLTLQAQELLTQAEVLIYDALIDPQLLSLVPATCLCLDAGKRGGRPSPAQAEIDQLLVTYCQQGQRVVRLQNGDPGIFGRCTSEIRALQAAGCEFELVPGLSSALAVPLLAGIPLTDPELSQGFAVISAHEPGGLNWAALSCMDTLVVLMGGKHLGEVVQQLLQQGRSPATPVAVIRWGGRRQQQQWRGTLGDILAQTAGESLSPAVVVVGAVAQLQLQSPSRPDLAPAQPLVGKTILVTRSLNQAAVFSDRLRQAGARVIEMPALEIVPPSTWQPLDRAIAQLEQFDWLILTSTNGVEAFMGRLLQQGKDARALAPLKLAVVGRKTATCLQQHGLQPDLIPPDFIADALVDHFPGGADLSQCKILFPRVETGGRETLVAELSARGAEVVEVPAYESRCPAAIAPEVLALIQGRAIDLITFASSKTVEHFCQLLERAAPPRVENPPQPWQTWLEGVCLASIGPQTSRACQRLLGRIDLEAEEYTLEGLTQSILTYYRA